VRPVRPSLGCASSPVRAWAEPGIAKSPTMSITPVGSLCDVPAGPRSGMQRAGDVWLSPQVAACFLSFRLPPSFDPQLPLCTPVPRGPTRYGARPRLLLGRRLPRGRVAALHAALGPGGLLDGRGLGRGALRLDAAPHTGSLELIDISDGIPSSVDSRLDGSVDRHGCVRVCWGLRECSGEEDR